MLKDKSFKITIVGLGYVGLPLAVEFGKVYKTVGFDINSQRIDELKRGHDRTREITPEQLEEARELYFTNSLLDTENCFSESITVFIITVPTPIDEFKKPDLRPLIRASKDVGKQIKKGDIVIYESTVYPGCTEEDCVPILAEFSGLKFNTDFYCGYSPERINPGDKNHSITKIKKITSGSTPLVAEFIDELYRSIIDAGTWRASSMKVAEAAKVIENCQRDINIAFVNELAYIFERMGIDTAEVLEAAQSKWNFLPFQPGLVGGHCIGVDPYYLTYKAESLGYHSQVILAGRRINDSIGKYVAGETIKLLIKNSFSLITSKILLLGITFKENCPDIRNSRVIDIFNELREYNMSIDVFDPFANKEEAQNQYKIDLIDSVDLSQYNGIIVAVAHQQFLEKSFIEQVAEFKGVIYDVKSIYDRKLISKRL